MRRRILYFSLAVCTSVSLPAAPMVSWDGNGHTYELVPDILTWTAAKTGAVARTFGGETGYLATITSQAEQDFVYSSFVQPGVHSAWIGLTDSELFGGQESGGVEHPGAPYWVWITGEPVVYTDWLTGEPNNLLHGPEGEDFAELVFTNTDGTPGRWNDLPDAYSDGKVRYYLVEYSVVPEPSTLALLSIGALAFVARVKTTPRGLEAAPL